MLLTRTKSRNPVLCLIYLHVFTFIFLSAFNTKGYAQTCSYPTGFQLIEGKNATPPSTTLQKPQKGISYKDPVYGTCAVRITNHVAEGLPTFARNDYSRRQAFNANNTIMLVYDYEGWWHIYNANTYQHIRRLPGPSQGLGGDAEPQWHPTNPDLLYFVPTNGGTTLKEINVTTDAIRVVADFRTRLPWTNAAHIWTKSEGSPSADGRYWGFQVETASFALLGYMIYDMVLDSVIATKAYTNRPDNCSMSPSGRYFVTSNFNPEGTVMYTRDLQTQKQIFGTVEHADMALNEKGEDVFVWAHYSAQPPVQYSGYVTAYNMDTGEYFTLFGLYANGTSPAIHFSGKAFNRPGWMEVSTYGTSGETWNDNKILVFELKPNGRILNIGHTYNNVCGDYFSETQASVNRDLTKIVWNSNWGAGCMDSIDVYMITLPPDAIPTAVKDDKPLAGGSLQTKNFSILSNPAETTIKFHVERSSPVQIKIFNHLGQQITTLLNEQKLAGTYSVKWNGKSGFNKKLPNGIYFCNLYVGNSSYTQKIMLLQ